MPGSFGCGVSIDYLCDDFGGGWTAVAIRISRIRRGRMVENEGDWESRD